MAKKMTMEQEARIALQEEKEIKENALDNRMEVDGEVIYSTDKDKGFNAFADILPQMNAAGLGPAEEDPELEAEMAPSHEEPEEVPFGEETVQPVMQEEEVAPQEESAPQEEVSEEIPEKAERQTEKQAEQTAAPEQEVTFTPKEELDLSQLPDEEEPEVEEEQENPFLKRMKLEENMTAEEFFPDDMSEEDILNCYKYLAEHGAPQFVRTDDGEEMEVVEETEEERHIRETERLLLEEEIEKHEKEAEKAQVSIYLNGKPATEEQFKDHVSKNRELYLGVLRSQFPAIKKMIEQDLKRQETIKRGFVAALTPHGKTVHQALGKMENETATEKDAAVVAALQRQVEHGQDLQTPAEAALHDADRNASLKEEYFKTTDELLNCEQRLFGKGSGPVSLEASLQNQYGEVEHQVRLARSKDGRIFLQLDGRSSTEFEIRKVLSEYPGQLRSATDYKMKLLARNSDRDER